MWAVCGRYVYLRPLVVYCDLIVAVGIFAGKEGFQRLVDVYLEATWLQGNLIYRVLVDVLYGVHAATGTYRD
jgi:hypothetical protein